jgi:hypothetical protein
MSCCSVPITITFNDAGHWTKMFHSLQVTPASLRLARKACTTLNARARSKGLMLQPHQIKVHKPTSQTAPAPDMGDLADLMQGLDSRGKAVIGPDVSTHLKVALSSSTTQYIYIYIYISMLKHMHIYIYVPTYVLLWSSISISWPAASAHFFLLPKHGWMQG